jgi:hypothetical protein
MAGCAGLTLLGAGLRAVLERREIGDALGLRGADRWKALEAPEDTKVHKVFGRLGLRK